MPDLKKRLSTINAISGAVGISKAIHFELTPTTRSRLQAQGANSTRAQKGTMH